MIPCWCRSAHGARGTEPPRHGATDVAIDHDSYENGAEVVADADAPAQALLITVTNTYDVPATL